MTVSLQELEKAITSVEESSTREVYWDWRWKRPRLETALSSLAGAGRFKATTWGLLENIDDAVFAIMRTINKQATIYQRMPDKQQQQQQHGKNGYGNWILQRRQLLSNIHPLREVELHVFYFPGENNTSNRFHFPLTLTSLKLRGGRYSGMTVWIDQILTDCPLLELFHAGAGSPLLINGPWVPPNSNHSVPSRLRS
ncbi:hypothetical protein BGX29_001101, partial [Mortierella sp. GBA35]